MKAAPSGIKITALSSTLALGGSTTFLLNFLRAVHDGPHRLSVVGFAGATELAADFAALNTELRATESDRLIYEDRLAWAYGQLVDLKPQAVLASLGPESFEILRLVPPGVVRIGIIQADEPSPFATARRYAPWLDAMVGVSEGIAHKLKAMPEFRTTKVEAIPYGIAFRPATARPPSSGPLRVIYLGRIIEEQKRVTRLAALIKNLPSHDFQFTIVGA